MQQDTTPRITADEFLSGVPGDPYPIGSELVDGVAPTGNRNDGPPDLAVEVRSPRT